MREKEPSKQHNFSKRIQEALDRHITFQSKLKDTNPSVSVSLSRAFFLSVGTMPRAGAMSSAEMRVRYFGDGRFVQGPLATNRVPRTNADIFLAITHTNTQYLLCIADSLAKNITNGAGPLRTLQLLGSQYYPAGNTNGAREDTPLRYYFASNGTFYRLFRDDQGLTQDGCVLLKEAIAMLITMIGGDAGNELLDRANAKVARLETQVAQHASTVKALREEVESLDKLLKENSIERPIECLNCGKHKNTCEDFGIKLVAPRMATVCVSKYANDYYINAEGNYVKCEYPEQDKNGAQYKETEGATLVFFGNAWNGCSKQEGDEGLCMTCSMEPLGMLSAKKASANRKEVGGFRYWTPTCCFHQGPATDCGIKWRQAPMLVCEQIQTVRRINATFMDQRRGVLPDITPSMVKSAGQLDCLDVSIMGKGLNGAGGMYATPVGEWVMERADTTMRDLITRHIARGRTHEDQVATRAMAQEIEDALSEDTDTSTDSDDDNVPAPLPQVEDQLLPADPDGPPNGHLHIEYMGHDLLFVEIFRPDPATMFAIYEATSEMMRPTYYGFTQAGSLAQDPEIGEMIFDDVAVLRTNLLQL